MCSFKEINWTHENLTENFAMQCSNMSLHQHVNAPTCHSKENFTMHCTNTSMHQHVIAKKTLQCIEPTCQCTNMLQRKLYNAMHQHVIGWSDFRRTLTSPRGVILLKQLLSPLLQQWSYWTKGLRTWSKYHKPRIRRN